MSENLSRCGCEARACFDALRDRYCIPPDMAVLDWLDQAARAWEELAEQKTCARCTKLAALVEDAYWEGYNDSDAECESLTDEWLQSDARRGVDELMGDTPTDEPIQHLSAEAIVADLRRLAGRCLGQGKPELCVVCNYAARTYERGKLMTTEPKGESNAAG